MSEPRPFLDLDHDFSLPGPGPGPTPPGPFFISCHSQQFRRGDDRKTHRRTHLTAPLNTSNTGFEVAPGRLTTTRPGQTPLEPDWGPFFKHAHE
jgi:hypothetical protein